MIKEIRAKSQDDSIITIEIGVGLFHEWYQVCLIYAYMRWSVAKKKIKKKKSEISWPILYTGTAFAEWYIQEHLKNENI